MALNYKLVLKIIAVIAIIVILKKQQLQDSAGHLTRDFDDIGVLCMMKQQKFCSIRRFICGDGVCACLKMVRNN